MGAAGAEELRAARPGRFDWESVAPIVAFNGLGTEELRRSIDREGKMPRGMFALSIRAEPGEPIPELCFRSFVHFREHEATICERVLEGVVKHYRQVREDIRSSVDLEHADMIAPVVRGVDDVRPLLALNEVYVHPAIDEVPDMGFGFECVWEEEHGLGVRVWGANVVLVGHHNDAFDARRHTEWALENMGDGMGGGPRAR